MLFRSHACQAAAAIKRIIINAGDAGGDGNAGKAGTVLECLIPNAGNAGGNDSIILPMYVKKMP